MPDKGGGIIYQVTGPYRFANSLATPRTIMVAALTLPGAK
jgi:hypothetical protein